MAEETKKPTPKKTTKKAKSPLVGSQAKPTVLQQTDKLDIDTAKKLVDDIIVAGLTSQLNVSALEGFTSLSNARDQLYQMIDTMAQDSSVSAILRTYAEDVCETSDSGHIVWAESDDANITKFVNYLLNTMNVDKYIFKWAYCLLKYGDVYLRLYRESDYEDSLFDKNSIDTVYGARNVLNEAVKLEVHKVSDPYSYYAEMIDDPSTMFELTKYGRTYGYAETPNASNIQNSIADSYVTSDGTTASVFNYRMKSNDVIIHQADSIVHACLEDNFTRYPETVDIFTTDEDYDNNMNAHGFTVRRGKSILADSYKIWREKSLLENAALLNRLTRSSIVRKVAVEVGDMSKEKTAQTLRLVKDMFEQKSSVNVGSNFSEYNNPGPFENNIYYATHGGQGAITIDSVGGDVDVKNLADLDMWNTKFYSSYGIPKQYFGWTDDGAGFNGGSSLTILSSVYSKGVKRVQNSLIQMITDAISLFLVNRGYRSYLNHFTIKMKAPLSQEEKDYREDLSNRVQAISNMQGLLTDVEDKGRRLEILKELMTTLNYGSGITEQIQKEIDAANEAKKKEEEQAAKEAAEAEAEAAGAAEPAAPEKPAGGPGPGPKPEGGDEDMDLNVDLASIPNAEESVESTGNTILTEDQIVTEDEDLPSPDELGDIDFSENK